MLVKHDIMFSVAPMMNWTDRHCRFFHRLLSRRARLYTEMLSTDAVMFGDRDRLLSFDPAEHPVAVQLGGADADHLARAARVAASYGYDEINFNVGCPSDRVQNGAFGACLMLRPALVGDCVTALKQAVAIPITVKCRIGVDDQAPAKALFDVAEAAVAGGVDGLIVHARKAWLQGLSPKENRDVPPLDYALVYALKQAFPQTPIAINGGIASLAQTRAHLNHVDGVMVGRAAYRDPALLIGVDPEIFGEAAPVADGFAAIDAFVPYIEAQLARGERLAAMTRHLLGLFAGLPGARAFRRRLACEAVRPGAGVEVLLAAVGEVRQAMARMTIERVAAPAECM
ncbi:MAG: tRNA dihydrouridine(20/20a) synthase DusA [Methylocystis sp.]|nr:tRNA dihydrouridine(20/20a) synthase DusA [Methylocystis sp.]